MISINEYLISKANKNPILTELEAIIKDYKFNISKDDLLKSITNITDRWDYYFENKHIKQIESRLNKIPSNVNFIDAITDEENEDLWDINDYIGQNGKSFAKDLRINNEDGEMYFQFIIDNDGRDQIYMIMIIDPSDNIALFVGK